MQTQPVTEKEATLSKLHLQLRTMQGIAYRAARDVIDGDAATTKPPIRRLLRLDARWQRAADDLETAGLYGVVDRDHVVGMLVTALRRKMGWPRCDCMAVARQLYEATE